MNNKIAATDYPVLDDLKKRWSPRAFGERPVSDDDLNSLFEAARWAASSFNEQPWRFVVARKNDEHYQQLFEGLMQGNKDWAWTAPVLGAAFVNKYFKKNGKFNRVAYHDLGLAMGNLTVEATRRGLAVHMMGGIIPENLYQNFNVDQEQYDAVHMFVIGYQDEKRLSEMDESFEKSELADRTRLPISDIVLGADFENPAPWLKK